MNAPEPLVVEALEEPSWVEANQRLLAAEFHALRARLGDAEAAIDADAQLAAAATALRMPAAIDHLSAVFGLSGFERSLLLLCAGIEMDSRLAASIAAAGRTLSFGLALGALPDAHWSALTPARPLRRWRLIEIDTAPALTSATLRIDERVLHYLAGINGLDPRLHPLLAPIDAPPMLARAHRVVADAVAAAWAAPDLKPRVINLCGDDAQGAEDIAASAAAGLGLHLLRIRSEDLPLGAAELDSFITLWEREAALLPAALLVQCADHGVARSVHMLTERLGARLLVASRDPLPLRLAPSTFEVHKPDAAEQKRLWQAALGVDAGALDAALDGVAMQYRLSAQGIAAAGTQVSEAIAAGEAAESALWATCRRHSGRRLDELAQRIPPNAGWGDLVLPATQIGALHQIAAQVRQRKRVYHDWGFGRGQARGLGIAALFCGESGTGKTLAAEVLATELHLDLYRIDLAGVVSKYIGETEKNLRRVFDAAEDSGAVLLFDEADALFGKRSEVKDSHDRYANIEVSYLLQRMEAYRGLAILTTNLKSALDPAFQRRLRFVVHFPFPDAEQREAIWRRAFPANLPSTGLDYARLSQLHATGGNVRNIALNAAFLAAEEARSLTMGHLLSAARAESAKLDRPLSSGETRGWQ